MPTIVKSFTSTNGIVVNPNGFRSAVPPRAKLQTLPLDVEPVPSGDRLMRNRNTSLQVIFPFGPQNIKHDKLAGKTVEIARPGKKPILFLENPNLRTVSFQAVIADKGSGGAVPITGILEKLETIATNAHPCNFTYGLTSLAYNVVITQFSYDVSYRNNAGEPLRAEVSIQLTETPVFTQEIQELKAVTKEAEPAKNTYTKGGGDNNEEDDNESRATGNPFDNSPISRPPQEQGNYYEALAAYEAQQEQRRLETLERLEKQAELDRAAGVIS